MPIEQSYCSLKKQTNADPEFSFIDEVIQPVHACLHLGKQMVSNKMIPWKPTELNFM